MKHLSKHAAGAALAALFVASLMFFASFQGFAQHLGERDGEVGDLPEVWLDSIATYLEVLDATIDDFGYRMQAVSQTLKKNGDVKRSDTTFFLYGPGEDEETRPLFEIDHDGNIIDTLRAGGDQHSEEEEDDTNGFSISFSPLAPFDPERRDAFRIWHAGWDRQGMLLVGYEPLDPEAEALRATVTVDTSLWAPVHVSAEVVKPPRRAIKEMDMELAFSTPVEGVYLPSRVVTRGVAKLLFFTIRFKSIQIYSDYRRE